MHTVISRGLDMSVVRRGGTRYLSVRADRPSDLSAFEGSVATSESTLVLEGPLSARNASAARDAAPHLRPAPLGLVTSVGTGDRLGLATPGHVRAFQHHGRGVAAVFAQQSIREMTRLGRQPQSVLDDATFGCLQGGWTGPVGADADHLKSVTDVDRCLAAGFSLYTIDVGDQVADAPASPTPRDLAAIPWSALEDDLDSALRRYAALRLDLGDTELRITERELLHAIAKYGPAVAAGTALFRHLQDHARCDVEVEIAVDETDEATTAAEHLYLATELARLGVSWVSFAPCHVGAFEKGVGYRGDTAALYRSLAQHARIAGALGPYKIGVHSGSDKFTIYPGIVEATGGLVHLKTSGTSYLVALGLAARHEPDLFRRIYSVSRDAYLADRASYPVSASAAETPRPQSVPDGGLPELLTAPATRQVLHVGYGSVLRRPDGRPSELDSALRALLSRHENAYHEDLASHIGRHLEPFAKRG